jgi:glycosyltransferase involved in cell wall biosynthesis
MKIIQLVSRIEGSGITRYILELNHALKLAGHDVEIIYVKAHEKAQMTNSMQNIPDVVEYDYSDETAKHLNEADLVILNSLLEKKADPEYREKWYDLLLNKITTKKVVAVNDHNVLGFAAYYGPLLHKPEFWLAFDKILTFSKNAKVAEKIRLACGSDEEFDKRFVHMIHPYEFENPIHDWLAPELKLRRVTYLGRHANFKDPTRLIRGRDKFYEHEYELEMRGIKRTINTSTIPDLLYSFDEVGNRIPSKACIMASDKKWRQANGIANDDLMINGQRIKNFCYVFDEYKREDGMMIMSNSAFGCNFYHLKDDGCYGDNFEYTIFEMIDAGTIPLLDWNMGNACHLYTWSDDGQETVGKSALELGLGIFIKKDLSNLDECLKQMDELTSNPAKYEEMRTKIYNAFKAHANPKAIGENLVKECFK